MITKTKTNKNKKETEIKKSRMGMNPLSVDYLENTKEEIPIKEALLSKAKTPPKGKKETKRVFYLDNKLEGKFQKYIEETKMDESAVINELLAKYLKDMEHQETKSAVPSTKDEKGFSLFGFLKKKPKNIERGKK